MSWCHVAITAPLILLLFACERDCPPAPTPARVGDTVVAIGDIMNTLDAEVKLSDLKPGQPELFVGGCKLGKAPNTSAVIQCLKNEVLVKFNCRDHTGPERALNMMIGAESFTIYCR